MAAFEKELRERAPFLRFVPIITVSALSGKRVRKVVDLARQVQAERMKRIPTAEVNRLLSALLARKQPPQGTRGDVRIYYASQVSTEPPEFILWMNRPKELRDSYLRYLSNGFRIRPRQRREERG
jgi:GTP-binding protein